MFFKTKFFLGFIALLLEFCAISGIEFSFEDFGVLSDGVRKRLALSWETDMEFKLAKETILSEIDRRMAAGELVLSGNTKAPELAEKVALSLSGILSRRSRAVEKIVSFAEKKSADYVFSSETLDFQGIHVNQMKDEFPVVRNENFGDDINKSFSAVHIPIDIYEGGLDILNDMKWSQTMDDIFAGNADGDPSVNWQYFASTAGWLKQWPAKQCKRDPDLYDARMEPWYLQGLSAPKHLLILIDTSGSTQGMIMRLIKVAATSLVNMLADWDRVSVATFSEMVSWPSCAHRFLPATPLNKQLLSEAISQLTSKGQAQLEPVLRFALEQFGDLDNVSSSNYDGYATCNKFVAILTDGDETFDPDDFIDLYRNMSVRIFVYGIGTTITGTSSLQSLAVKTNGLYSEIRQMNAVRHSVQNVHQTLATLSTPWETHPVLVATVSDSGRSRESELYEERLFSMVCMSHSNLSINLVESPGQGYLPSLAVAKPAFNRTGVERNEPPSILGVAGADIRTSELLFALNPVLYDPAGYAFIVAHNGYVILHSRHAPRKVGPSDNKDPNVIAFTEVPIHITDSEPSAVPLLYYSEWEEDNKPPKRHRERKTSSLLYYGNKDYASEEKRWVAYSPVANSSLGVVVSIRENGVEILEPSDQLPLDFNLRVPNSGDAPYFVDLKRVCAAAGGIIAKYTAMLQQPHSSGGSNLSSVTSPPLTTFGSGIPSHSTTAEEEGENWDRFGEAETQPVKPESSDFSTHFASTTQTSVTTTPAPNYNLLHQQATIAFLQAYGNNKDELKQNFCDQSAIRHVGLDLILLRQLLNSLSNLQVSNDNSTSSIHLGSTFHLNDDGLPIDDLFSGQALAWAVVFPSGVHYSRPSNGLTMACVADPLKLPVYQHAAYTRDKVFAQPAPCPGYVIVARSVHLRSLALATVVVVYNSSSLLPENCTNCMLLDDGGFLLAASNRTVARSVGSPLSLLDASLYRLLVVDSNVYSVHSSRMLVRPCPPGAGPAYTIIPDMSQESSAISHFLTSSVVHRLTSISWWATLFSGFGRVLADTATQAVNAFTHVDEEVVLTTHSSEGSGIEMTTELPPDGPKPLKETIDQTKSKCSRESLADDWGLPRKGRICAIRHPTLIPGPSFYISQLRPFACGHHCTRTAAWAPVRGTNLLFVVTDPPCAGCNPAPSRHASLFAFDIDASFDTCHLAAGARSTSSVFSTHKYYEQPEQVDWICTPLVFPPHSKGLSLHQSLNKWLVSLLSLAVILPFH